MASLKSRIQRMDLFRSIPADLTEATTVGGVISGVTVLALVVLFVMETTAFFAITPVTRVEISHGEDQNFRVNFNVTFPELSCEWVTVDIFDVIGHKKTNITDNTVHRYSLHGNYVAPAVKSYDAPVVGGSTDAAVYEGKRYTVPLTTVNFKRVVHEYKAMMVAFMAPWCHHCQALKPIYEHAAEIVGEAMSQRSTHGRWQRDVALATVDCTADINQDLCTTEHIQAFPTIRVFRRGTDRSKGLHESYRGDRTAEAISTFALGVLKEVEANKALPAGSGSDHDGDGDLDSMVHSHGCRVEGYLRVSRVPGTIVFSPHAVGHDFHVENINMSHIVTGLSFGAPIAGSGIPRKYRRKLPIDLGGAYAAGDARRATLFTSNDECATHEHYIKVVPTAYEPLRGSAIETYEYTINSHTYEMPGGDGEDQKPVPMVRLSYDISPMQVVVAETARPLIDGIIGMLAIMGGVYTAFALLTGMVQGAWRAWKKGQEGKLS